MKWSNCARSASGNACPGIESWTVLGPDGVPVGPVERYLTYLTDTERSLNTVKAYAY